MKVVKRYVSPMQSAARNALTQRCRLLSSRDGKDKTSHPQQLSTNTISGFFYEPCNPRYTLRSQERPPLVVLTHGGPTALNSPVFHPRVQFYTSRGFAVLDVCYRGSTGFGRDYHRALYGRWGRADVGGL